MTRLVSVCVLALFALPARAAPDRPRLGVMIVVDQLSAESFRARLPKTKDGFKRLTQGGTVFDEARFESAPTVTSAGHSTLVTGTYPEVHGIVANEWLEGETGRPRLSTEDSTYHVLGRPPRERDGTAPTWLRAPTLSDAVRLSNESAKAVVVSAKDRSGILCSGRAGLGVWFDAEAPLFTTSTFFASQIPAWVAPINERLAKAVDAGVLKWEAPPSSDGGVASARQGDSEPLAERPENQATIDAAEVDVALAAVKALELGKDEVPDLLTISFSGHDRIGHQFGPDSPEGIGEFMVLDKEIGRLLDGLDAAVGKDRYVVVLTSDHGVAPAPEVAKARGLDAGRVDTRALGAALDKALDEAVGPGDWIAGYKSPGFLIAPTLRGKVPPMLERLRAVARQQPGVLDLLWSASLDPGRFEELPWKHGTFAGRTADLIVVTKPYWTYGTKDHTHHGTTYLYDRAVPLVVYGAGVKKQQLGVVEVVDIAPSLAKLINVAPPAAAIGKPIDALFR